MTGGAAARAAELGLAAWLLAAFVMPNEAASALVFYLAVVPTTLWRLRRHRPRAGPGGWAGFALIGWSAATLAWGEGSAHRVASFALGAACTAVLLASVLLVLPAAESRRRLVGLLIAAGGANAAWSIAAHLATSPRDPRLHGWGVSEHPILGASVIAVVGLTAAWRVLRRDGAWRWSAASAAACALFILMTDSRGPLLAAAVAAVVLCGSERWRWRALPVLPAIGVAWLGVRPGIAWLRRASGRFARGGSVAPPRDDSHRLEIWHHSWRLVRARPWGGHGLAASIDLPDYTFPHDLYLSLLFYSGAVGAALFAAMAGLAARCVWRARASGEWPWLAALGTNLLVSGLTDFGQVTKGPGALSIILWVPVGFMLTACKAPPAAQRLEVANR